MGTPTLKKIVNILCDIVSPTLKQHICIFIVIYKTYYVYDGSKKEITKKSIVCLGKLTL
jgi:hypothetical protein